MHHCPACGVPTQPSIPARALTIRLPPACLQKMMLGHVDALLADAPRRSVLLCDSSKQGDDGGCVAAAGSCCLLAAMCLRLLPPCQLRQPAACPGPLQFPLLSSCLPADDCCMPSPACLLPAARCCGAQLPTCPGWTASRSRASTSTQSCR